MLFEHVGGKDSQQALAVGSSFLLPPVVDVVYSAYPDSIGLMGVLLGSGWGARLWASAEIVAVDAGVVAGVVADVAAGVVAVAVPAAVPAAPVSPSPMQD